MDLITKSNNRIIFSPRDDFVPSMRTLMTIFKILLEKNHETKTNLSLFTNLNYGRLLKHIDWMEKKGFVESIVKNDRENIIITESGRSFASVFSV